MVVKYQNCSLKVDYILRFTKDEFVKAFMGRAYFSGPKQAQMLADCYDKAVMLSPKKVAGGEELPAPSLNEEEHDHSGYADEPDEV